MKTTTFTLLTTCKTNSPCLHRNCIHTSALCNILQKPKPLQLSLPKSLLRYLDGILEGSRGITACYWTVNDPMEPTKTDYMLAWEGDLQHVFPIDQWHTAVIWTLRSSRCVFYWEMSIKLIHCWYCTPQLNVLSHISTLLEGMRTTGFAALCLVEISNYQAFLETFIPVHGHKMFYARHQPAE